MGLSGVSNFLRKRENDSVSHTTYSRTSKKRAISSLDLESPSWSFQNWPSECPVGPVGPAYSDVQYLSTLVRMILAQNGHRETIPEVDFDILSRNQKDNRNCRLKWTN